MTFCGTGSGAISTVDGINGIAFPDYTGPTVADVISQLTNHIELSHLATTLRDRINLITDLQNGLTVTNSLITSETDILAQELLALRNDLTGAVAYINTQTTVSITERQALVNSVNTMMAQFGLQTAALEESSTVLADQTGKLFAEKTVKTDLAGNVAGYGLSSEGDPTTGIESSFRVAADTFSIAPPAIHSETPPPNPYSGKVWVDTSVTPPVPKWYNTTTSQWQTTPVQGAVPFIVKTTQETLPNGMVVEPGVYMDSAYITQLTADQIDTRGLLVRDASGNVLFGAGTDLDWNLVGGVNRPADGATRNVYVGAWTASTTYDVGDIVMDAGYGWACEQAHVSTALIKPPTYPVTSNAYWSIYSLKGDQGANGTRTALLELYQWANTAPTLFPSGSSTYTWATGAFGLPATPNSWTLLPGTPTAGQTLWGCSVRFADSGTSATSTVTWNKGDFVYFAETHGVRLCSSGFVGCLLSVFCTSSYNPTLSW